LRRKSIRDIQAFAGPKNRCRSDPLGSAVRNNLQVDQVADSFVADLEVKIIDGKVHTELLRWYDGRTSARDTYEQTFIDGEACTATQTPIGVYEVFTSLRGDDQIHGTYFEDAGGAATVAIQMIGAGYTSYRGFHIESNDPSCPESDTPATTERVYLPLGFDSTQLRNVGDTVTIDQRSDGVGWLLTVRYEQRPHEQLVPARTTAHAQRRGRGRRSRPNRGLTLHQPRHLAATTSDGPGSGGAATTDQLQINRSALDVWMVNRWRGRSGLISEPRF
jgi:hypothetical protein